MNKASANGISLCNDSSWIKFKRTRGRDIYNVLNKANTRYNTGDLTSINRIDTANVTGMANIGSMA